MQIMSSRPCVAAFVLLVAGVMPAHGTGIERSPADTRDYRAVMLDNGLEALVVSDPDADKAAAALNVNVGSGNDPDTRPGLAHFVEHMLFLGTEKYPDPGEYSRFLTEHGGSSNATTSFANTSYFFDVDAAHLEGALDRFAQFFVSPVRPRVRRARATGRALGVRLAAAQRQDAQVRRMEAGSRSSSSARAVPGRHRGDPRGPPRRRGPRRADRFLRAHLLFTPHEARRRRPGAARRAGRLGAGAVQRGAPPRIRAVAHHRAALSGRTPAGAARHRTDPGDSQHLALVRDSAAAPALPGASAGTRLVPARTRRPRQSALGAQGARLGGGIERRSRHGTRGFRDVRHHHQGDGVGARTPERRRRIGVRLPGPRSRGRHRAALPRRACAHGAHPVPLPGEDRRPRSRGIARLPPCTCIRRRRR